MLPTLKRKEEKKKKSEKTSNLLIQTQKIGFVCYYQVKIIFSK